MELLLNLLWLFLAMPAFWLWHYSRTAPEKRRSSPIHCLLALGCLLVVLFPVISATDDLHAMRAEMEEPNGKRSICRAGSDRPHCSKCQFQPALSSFSDPLLGGEFGFYIPLAPESFARAVSLVIRAGRAPPCSSRA